MSVDVAVRVESLGKRYVRPHASRVAGSRRAALSAHLKEFFPFLAARDESDWFWALRDVSFEVGRGEVLGIFGRNGSGKSTLLKILSGVTVPTTGRAELNGRVGSLLEVGTGFHPDLTGRENVFLSGAVLGIPRAEIARRFDEIVDFSGIEDFIDVPVKRYSSGMYVRLAYSVAALLQSDVLILDEVLAVGDVAFREKSQRNIEKAAKDGRTVLFVSHNVRAANAICSTGMVLQQGALTFRGTAREATAQYLREVHHHDEAPGAGAFHDLAAAPRLEGASQRVLAWVSTHRPDGTPSTRFATGQGLRVRIGFRDVRAPDPYFSVLLLNEYGDRVATIHSTHGGTPLALRGDGVVECEVEDLRLGTGRYQVMIDHGSYGGSRALTVSLDCVPNAARIDVELDGWLGGVGLDGYQGAAHRSRWRRIAERADAPPEAKAAENDRRCAS